MTIMEACAPPRSAPLPVSEPVHEIPVTIHVCVICDHVDFEESETFDMSHCSAIGGWVDRECHHMATADGICRDPLCDPSHI